MQKKRSDKETIRLMKRAFKHIEAVASYRGGDKWEREATAVDCEAYRKLYRKIFGKDSRLAEIGKG